VSFAAESPVPHVDNRKKHVPHAVDLFCGIGGLSRGLMDGGFSVVAGYDLDGTCEYAYKALNVGAEFIRTDIAKVTAADILKHYPKDAPKILVGCAPCQPFSSLTQKKGKAGETNGREDEWGTLDKFADLIVETSVDVASMENVTRLANREKYDVFARFVTKLEAAGYTVTWSRAYGPDYGIPQTRRRLVLFASKHGQVDLIKPTHKRDDPELTVRHVFRDMKALTDGEADPKDPLHVARRMSDKNRERIRASTPGGTWRDWDRDLRVPCHTDELRTYGSVYGRMIWDAPGSTVTTQFYNYGTGRFGHPEQHRAISLREGALLQTFAPDAPLYDPNKKIHFTRLGRHIGNAVPVRLGAVIADSITAHLEGVKVI
jgi:DNA (cytosine-5)-methyltransferase 1